MKYYGRKQVKQHIYLKFSSSATQLAPITKDVRAIILSFLCLVYFQMKLKK